MTLVAAGVAFALMLALLFTSYRLRQAQRADFIRSYSFPKGLIEKLQLRRPGLEAKNAQLVARALRQFFLAHLRSGRQYVSMPSQAADDLWHEFILYTRNYELFCRQAFGRFLHHTPAVVLGSARLGNAGLRRVWWQCCREENINPRHATRLPLLFALDAKLGIADGFHYVPDCGQGPRRDDRRVAGGSYCAGEFGDAGIDGSTDGFGDGGGGFGGGDGDGGGDGGGCGGGGGD